MRAACSIAGRFVAEVFLFFSCLGKAVVCDV